MLEKQQLIKTQMKNIKEGSFKKEKKSKKIGKIFSDLFKKKHNNKKEVETIENDEISVVSNCATINTSEDCYIKPVLNKQYDSETTLYSSTNSSIYGFNKTLSPTSSTNDIFYNKINSSTFPPVTHNDCNASCNLSYSSATDFCNKNCLSINDISPKQNNLNNNRNITRASFYSTPPVIIPNNRIPLKLIERDETTIPILNNNMAEQIRTKIPNLYKEAIKWKLLYSIDQHGLSLKTLYSNIKHAGPCVMALTTENDEIFGAFTSEPFDPSVSNNYYGSGLSFIWKLNKHGNIDFYQAINSNRYYMLADKHFIAMGGG